MPPSTPGSLVQSRSILPGLRTCFGVVVSSACQFIVQGPDITQHSVRAYCGSPRRSSRQPAGVAGDDFRDLRVPHRCQSPG